MASRNHEEADTRMMVHAADALKCGHRQIFIRPVDADVILAVALANERSGELDELWLNFGTGKNRCYVATNQIAKALRPRGLPAFQAITGCDTVSSLAGHSKNASWDRWKAFPPSLVWLTLQVSCSVVSCLLWRDSSCCSLTARSHAMTCTC